MKLRIIFFVLLASVAAKNVRAADATVLASINGENITEKQVMDEAVKQIIENMNPSKLYDMKSQALEDIINDKLLQAEAKKKGVTSEALLKQIETSVPKVSENEARTFYEMQKKRFGDKSFDEVKTQLMGQMATQKRMTAINDFYEGLKKTSKVTINLERPRINVSVDDDPSQGTKGAPITLIEFSDYQCPFCKKTRGTISQLMTDYSGKINYVFRDFPLSFHSQAKGAANAANCANEQGKYWDYNKALWNSQGKHTDEELMKIAGELKLDGEKFKKCVADKKYFSEIDKDQRDGMTAGVSGTPAYFINGIFLSGAVPIENFKAIIDEELKNKK